MKKIKEKQGYFWKEVKSIEWKTNERLRSDESTLGKYVNDLLKLRNDRETELSCISRGGRSKKSRQVNAIYIY